MRCLVVTLSQDGLTAFSATVRLPFDICKILHKKIALRVRKHKGRLCQNLKKTHFFGFGCLRELSRSSQGRLSVKSCTVWRNKKRKNLNI